MLVAGALLGAQPAAAATYYVRNGGNDSADGASHATAWATLAHVNAAPLASGDRVLFHEGDRFAGQLKVHWGGTASQTAVVGSYYVEKGVAKQGYRTARPVIDGEDKVPTQYDGLVRVSYGHVHLMDLAVLNSEGKAIEVLGDDVEVSGCYTDNSYKSGIHYLRSARGIVRGNVIKHAGRALPERNELAGGALEIVSSSDALIERNRVEEVYGEGIGMNNGSARNVVQDNYVFGVLAVGIYLDVAPDATVRRNIVLGTTNPEYWRHAGSVGGGIVLNNEPYHYAGSAPLAPDVQSQRAKIYDNLIAFTSPGIAMWGGFDQTSFDDELIFNNTLVDNDVQVEMSSRPKPGSLFVNNILLSLSKGTRDVNGTSLNGMIARSNYFSQGDPGGDYSSAKNVYTGVKLVRMSDWRSIATDADVNWRDFALQAGSAGAGAGENAPRSMANSIDTFDLDFNRAPHNAPMDLGAVRYSTLPYNKPNPPFNLAAD